jgi:ubiquinone/menaquinone biosynthesis C-methylase UbiE
MAQLTEFRDTVLGNAHIRPGETVVDAGTGTGLIALGAVERVGADGDVFAVDISVDCLEELRRVATAPNLFFLIGSADVLPLPDDGVDVVCTRSVLIYVQDKAEATREFFRVLRGGGRVSIFEPINRRNTRLSEAVDFGALHEQVVQWETATYEDPDDPMLNFDEHDLARHFRDAGFVGVTLDLRPGADEISAERTLTAVGAPGRRSLLDAWGKSFPPATVARLAEAVRARGTIQRGWPQLYLSARKP